MIMQQIGLLLSVWIISFASLIGIIYTNAYLYRFPRLKFWALRKYARRIVNKFPRAGIKQISIQKYDSPYAKSLGRNVPTKYHLIIQPKIPLSNEGKELLFSAVNFHGIDGPDPESIGLNNDFSDGYKRLPDGDFWREWSVVVPSKSGEIRSEGCFDKKWILYRRNFT